MSDESERPEILLLEPTFVRRVWGGDALPRFLGRDVPASDAPATEPVAEAWLASRDSVVASGRWTGRTLAGLIEARPVPLLGEASVRRYGAILPLWVKLLDARDDLSIQVHPNDEQAAAAHPGASDLGKTESWVIVASDRAASITWGTVPTSPAEVRRAIEEGSLARLMRTFSVAEGDVIHNPAGTVHAVHAGLTIYELQQASDLTYRLWDYGRVGADGRPRDLHVDASLAVAHLDGKGTPFPPPPIVSEGWATLVRCDPYLMEEAAIARDAGVVGDTCHAAFHLLTVVDGSVTCTPGAGTEHADDGGSVTMRAGSTVFVGAEVGPYRLEGAGRVIRGRPNVDGNRREAA